MKRQINIKTQTNRATSWKEGVNCVNLFLGNTFEMGLRTTEWGSNLIIIVGLAFGWLGYESKWLTINLMCGLNSTLLATRIIAQLWKRHAIRLGYLTT